MDFKSLWHTGVLLHSVAYSGMSLLTDSFFRFHKTLVLGVDFESI